MDSGNSGSMQSSSTGGGGDEEYDSRAESSISAFLNNPPPPLPQSSLATFTATATNHPNPQQHHLHPRIFDPLSNYLDPIQRSHQNSSLLNLDMVWSNAARSEPNPSHLGGLIPCSISSSTQNQQAFLSSQLAGQTRGAGVAAFRTTHHSLQPPPETAASRGGVLLSDDQAHNNTNTTTINNNNNANTNMVRNPKKRSRASRRAPTTVLTTDTTNFRAMVQEFTGIPAPPFTSSSFPRTRLDLFGSAPTSSTIRSLDPPQPPYLLRPFPQKLHHFPPSTTSIPSMMDTLASNHSTNSLTNSTSISYQLSSSSSADHLGLLKQQQQPLNVMNMNSNPILSFQSILQAPPPKYTLENSSNLLAASKTKAPLEIPHSAVDSHLKMGVLEELGLSHVHVNTHVSGLHHNMLSSSPSDGALSSRVNNNDMRNPSSADWAQRMGSITNNDGDHVGVLRSSSDFNGGKAPECGVAARSEGMVESWINCSSD